MGVWYYLVNDTKQQRISHNYGKWDEFDPEEEWIKAKEDVEGWTERDTYRWVSDDGDFITLPLKKPSPWKDVSRVYYDEMTEEEFEKKWPTYDLEGVAYWEEVAEFFDQDDWYETILDNKTGYKEASISQKRKPETTQVTQCQATMCTQHGNTNIAGKL